MSRQLCTVYGIITLAGTLVVQGCVMRDLTSVDPRTESYVMDVLDQAAETPVDILVVVDNSMSMSEEQENLAEEFPALIRELLNPPSDAETGEQSHPPVQDLHIGVISTDMGSGGHELVTCEDPVDGDDGILLSTPGRTDDSTSFLSYQSGEPDTDLVERMASDFGRLSHLGTDGCGFEQQLEAALKALTVHADGANAGFLRQDSILAVLFVTDEEDCSVAPGNEEIFDVAREDLGHVNLRCFNHPDMVHPVERYIEGFRAMKDDPEKLVFGFIVGVPIDEACEGSGDGISTCLEHADMQERIDETRSTPDRLVPSCATENGEAYPPRRLVQVARSFGDQALVHSICRDDFGPAIRALTDRLLEAWTEIVSPRELAVDKDPADGCRCLASCTIIEELSDARECPPEKPCHDPDGTGCAMSEDPDGNIRSMCVVPQAGTHLTDCSMECADPASHHTPDGEGWYYLPYNDEWMPQVAFTESMVPSPGSTTHISCDSLVCPANRQCGPEGFEASVCCSTDSYCDRLAPEGPTCTPRPD